MHRARLRITSRPDLTPPLATRGHGTCRRARTPAGKPAELAEHTPHGLPPLSSRSSRREPCSIAQPALYLPTSPDHHARRSALGRVSRSRLSGQRAPSVTVPAASHRRFSNFTCKRDHVTGHAETTQPQKTPLHLCQLYVSSACIVWRKVRRAGNSSVCLASRWRGVRHLMQVCLTQA